MQNVRPLAATLDLLGFLFTRGEVKIALIKTWEVPGLI